ncbi:WG repeat-containing protein [uncultured Microscilla sp.]|uniref:WG repeat-containing protein n=1 Tax=uncultured Microscilla sp. TaxID=432653 RepID=UPI00260DF625|nr:WG repeat-containing protein [uncultured Microscilla sp.]
MTQQFDEKSKGGFGRKIKFTRDADDQEPQKGKYEDILKSVVVTGFILAALIALITQVNIPETKRPTITKKKVSETEKERIRRLKQYSSVGYFHEGYARAEKNGKYGFVDENGKEVIPPKYEWVGKFKEGVVRVFNNNKAGYIEKAGKVVIPEKYDDAWEFSEGLAKVMLVKNINDKTVARYGFVNKKGQEVVTAQYEDAQSFHGGLAAVRKGGKWGYVNQLGKVIIPFKYNQANSFIDGFAMVSVGDENPHFISRQGDKYDDFRAYEEGMAAVRKNGKWGFIDEQGKLMIPYRYDEVRSFKKGWAQVRTGKKKYYINKEGKRLK